MIPLEHRNVGGNIYELVQRVAKRPTQNLTYKLTPMNTCSKYEELPQRYKEEIGALIRRVKGKSNVADVTIEESDLKSYRFKLTVSKYNNSGSRGWSTVAYLRHDIFKGDRWRLTYQPRLLKGERANRNEVGRTGTYQ